MESGDLKPFQSKLPISLQDLIFARTVENTRLEFKPHCDKDSPSERQIIESVCAFSNDFQAQASGYIIIGTEVEDGQPVLPPRGIPVVELDAIQRRLYGHFQQRIQPPLTPLFCPVEFQGQQLLVIWCPASESRPHKAQAARGNGGDWEYFVRIGSNTIAARGKVLEQLREVAVSVPFDDRRNLEAKVEEISESLVRSHLSVVESELATEPVFERILNGLRLTTPVNAHSAPRNVALLFFSHNPEQYFPGTRIDVVEYRGGPAGDVFNEEVFLGPLPDQIQRCKLALQAHIRRFTRKIDEQPEALVWHSYPSAAIDEALVNAVCHRGYSPPSEPVQIRLRHDRMEIISYPGPAPSLNPEHFAAPAILPPVRPRNPRVAEFLKERRLAEVRHTGIQKIYAAMRSNGSPDPVFDFDEDRTYFRVTLPVHPDSGSLHSDWG